MLHMEQKDYKLEIVNVLINGENHIRGIAGVLNINHMMIVRKIKEINKENIVDFRREGKNKIFCLKSNSESKEYVLMAEEYKIKRVILIFILKQKTETSKKSILY